MKQLIAFLLFTALYTGSEAQGLQGLMNKAKEIAGGRQPVLNNDDIVAGLKEALVTGSQKGASSLSQVNGFFANAALKILLPPEAAKMENTLRKVGLGKQVDDAILSMNRAAEDACKSAAPIFIQAVKTMSVQDAMGILKGSDTAATAYLRNKTHTELSNAFRPVISQSLAKVDATQYWNTVVSSYNKLNFLGGQKINPDLSAYVTDKALAGIFLQVGQEEQNIRRNPVARTSELLKKVFGN